MTRFCFQRFGDRVGDFVGPDLDRAREPGDFVAATDFHDLFFFDRNRAPDLDLDLFGRALADPQVVFAFDPVANRLVELVAADPERARDDDPVERDHRDFGRAAANVDDHIAGRIGHGHASANRGGQRLADQVGSAGSRIERRVANRASFDAGDASGHADHDLGANQREAAAGLIDEVAEHFLGDDVIGDHTVAHWANDFNRLTRFAPEHVAGFKTNGLNFSIFGGNCHHGGFIDDNAASAHKNEDVGRPQVDAYLFRHAVVLRLAAGRSCSM